MNKSNIIIGTLIASLSLVGSSMVFAENNAIAGKADTAKITKSKKSLFIANEIHVDKQNGEKDHYIILKHVHGDGSHKEAKELLEKKAEMDKASN